MEKIYKDELFITAVQLANMAGEISKKYFRNTDLIIDNKSNNTPVTIADHEIETTVRNWLHELYPEHGVIGEEMDDKASGSEYTWVIDPIDGTVAFTTGKPTFTTLIALLKNNEPILGIIDQPIINERFIGFSEVGAWLNGTPIRSSTESNLANARINATTPYMFKDQIEQDAFERLKEKVRLVSWGGDAYAYGLLAAGQIEIIMEANLGYYDVAALIPLIKMSGGVITDWQGNPISSDFKGQCLASSNAKLHDLALKIIN